MSYTILVVEDDKNINEVVTEYMKDAGYVVISSEDGETAQKAIQANPNIDLFVLDIMLPGISGLELLHCIRETEEHRNKPVIILTAIGDEATQLFSFDEMADDYVTKPFSPKILVKRVQSLIRRSVHESPTLQYGDLLMNFDSYEVFDFGKRVKLTLREFELLSVLMTNAGKVLSRQQLLNHAWGYNYFGDERIVDVHVKNLRKKLKSNVITTVKGVGYKLEGGI
ncbi:MAG: response regulator transcription factor [Ruminococcaceae bacterium]|nr:response regulator transcription factor [Oscillospiraceae bacterium]